MQTVDAAGRRSYVAGRMNLLLLLSALLSALTGVGGAARAVEPAAAVSGIEAQRVDRAQPASARILRVPVAPPTLRQSAAGVALPPAVIATIPAWLTRRRE